jgi:hypothetical protein
VVIKNESATESGEEDKLDVDLNSVVDSDEDNKMDVDVQALVEEEKMDVHSKAKETAEQ